MKSNGHQNILDDTMKKQDRSIKSETDALQTLKSSMPGIPPAPEPSQQLLSRRPQDIVCGRGLHIQCHQGNSKLHQIVNGYRRTYKTSTRKEKAAIAERIVEEIKSSGSRFIRRVEDDNDGDRWEEVSNETAYRKVGHALRLQRDHKPRSKPKETKRKSQLSIPTQDSMIGSAYGITSAALHNGILAPSLAVPQLAMAPVTPLLPAAFLPNPAWYLLDRNLLLSARTLMTPQAVPQLLHPPFASAILNPSHGQQLLVNPLLSSVLNSRLTSMTHHASEQQKSKNSFETSHPVCVPRHL